MTLDNLSNNNLGAFGGPQRAQSRDVTFGWCSPPMSLGRREPPSPRGSARSGVRQGDSGRKAKHAFNTT